MLTIHGDHDEKKEEKDEGRRYHRIECHRGSFRRTIPLPATVQEDKIDASFKEGVLTIKMPKAEESKAKKIAVKG
jgi:HSP20 family protein